MEKDTRGPAALWQKTRRQTGELGMIVWQNVTDKCSEGRKLQGIERQNKRETEKSIWRNRSRWLPKTLCALGVKYTSGLWELIVIFRRFRGKNVFNVHHDFFLALWNSPPPKKRFFQQVPQNNLSELQTVYKDGGCISTTCHYPGAKPKYPRHIHSTNRESVWAVNRNVASNNSIKSAALKWLI